MYRAKEMKLGRIFQVNFDAGDDYMVELTKFVKDNNIRAGSVFLLGALAETEMISGLHRMIRLSASSPTERSIVAS